MRPFSAGKIAYILYILLAQIFIYSWRIAFYEAHASCNVGISNLDFASDDRVIEIFVEEFVIFISIRFMLD